MSSIKREAIKDAHEYAMAKMFYGEGAGVRRRLINQTVQFKIANIPGYDVSFQQELAKQDFAKLSRAARRERKLLDAKDAVNKNGRAIARGDYRSTSLPVLAIIGVGYVAHQTGFDKEAWKYSKKQYNRAKGWTQKKRAEMKARHESPKKDEPLPFPQQRPNH
jgi:hypothetical protein